ncbi:MAG TPA: sigma-70 family RNA polymerase sigma factor [Anaerolineales bacterium]|nr:sigma-70 family RNA polymerase sigma factor [Anaerolineales bacterium]
MDEQALIGDARRGDLEAFNRLVLTHQAKAYNLAWRITGDPELAADATQEAFLSAFRKIGTYRGGSFRAWILRIVTNACYDELRHHKRRPAESLEALEEESMAGEGMGDPQALASHSDDPATAHERAEVVRAIERCLDGLPADFRTVVVLADVLALDYGEVAAAMGTPVGTVRSRLARARARLRECLEPSRELLGREERLAEGNRA